MVKKSTLSKKLASYSALATAIIAVNHEANAQIIYTDLTPPVTLPSTIEHNYDTSAYLDLNNDGTPDFQFMASGQLFSSSNNTFLLYSSNGLINANGLRSNSVNRIGTYSGQIPNSVPNSWAAGAVLAKEHIYNLIFSGTNSHPSFSSSGNFINVNNKYLPLELKNNGNTYYGWARLSTNYARQLTISSYAYNSTPNSPIVAGNTGCSFTPITPVVTIKNDTIESTSANKYQWFFNGDSIPGDTLPAITHSQQGYYAVLTTDVNGCLSESQAKYFSCYSVKPIVSENSGFSNPSCIPAELQAINLVNGTYIQWLRNGDTLTTATARTYLADSSGSYNAEFIDSGKTCYLISDTVQLTVTQIPLPVVSTTNHNTVLCPGGESNISLTDSTDYTAADTLQWYFNGTLIARANKSIYAIDTTGTYFLSITSNACYKYSDTTIITRDIEHPSVILGGTDTLKTQLYTSYQWYRDNALISGGTNQYYTAPDSGTYYVIITDSLGCSFQSPDYYYSTTGLATAVLPEQISIYSYDKILHVLFTDESLVGSPLRIYNTLGQEVFSTTLTTGQTEIDMSSLTAGLYIVEVNGKTSSVIKKVVVE